MRSYRFVTADVFTARTFGGNQLAVLPDARGLNDDEMLAITREFNYSESTFVFPPSDPANTRRVRIFTPGGEVPFAGHPTIGTAFALATIGDLALVGSETVIRLEENVGVVPVKISAHQGAVTACELSVAKLPEVVGTLPDREVMAAMLSLDPSDLLDGSWHPQPVSCGLPFTLVPLASRDAVRRARIHIDLWERQLAKTAHHMILVFCLDAEEAGHDIRARMFAPGISIPEDPATGSACAALAGYLAARAGDRQGTLRWIVEQGYEMGRPSVITIEADKHDGSVAAVRVAGASTLVCQGTINIPSTM